MLTTFLLLALCLVTHGQQDLVLSQGSCPDIPVQLNFDLKRFEGYWKVYEAFGAPYIVGMSCVDFIFEQALDDGRYVNIRLEGDRDVKVLGFKIWTANEIYYGRGTVLDDVTNARWSVLFGGKPDNYEDKTNYFILATDYINYAIVYSCIQPAKLPIISESCFILLRRNGSPPAEISTHKFNLKSYGVNVTNLNKVNNYNCY
ncbi:apolipoprotein D isoform X2 [Biomphalaria pfeifferi]|uniref:Apolipoprotein D isoform X2 n=1 Tax=Biomphalaria pfeifferi TaxID=112525 RepID=A0AAD8BQW2_BIOPF|nr:apolipoprotein D isoform X2 [Biomphalaria pfeifferi]